MTIQKKSKGAGSLLSLSHHYLKMQKRKSVATNNFEFLIMSDFAKLAK